jgi:dienelactone hydrolase/lysophospholipase L1-like esterase
MLKKVSLLCFLIAVLCSSNLSAREPIAPANIWDLQRLSTPPKATWGKTEGLVQEVYYEGEPLAGKPTRVFAYVGRPAGEGPFPGVVLVHGGGGQAFSDWARHWAKRGYVSISMDTAGCGPGKKRLEDGGPGQGHEFKFRNFEWADAKEMWTYHAVADVVLAHSLLRSLPEVDAEKTALTGISWGGYLTCITAGVDSRFKAAVPVYGCGFLHDNSVWSATDLAGMEQNARRLWVKLFDPGQHVGRVNYPILFFNGTNDFAYPLDSYRKTIEQVDPALATTAIHLNLRHGHIWSFPIVDTFIDAAVLGKRSLARVGEVRIAGGEAYAPILNDAPLAKGELLYTVDKGPWQQRKWTTLTAEIVDGRVRAKLPAERPIAFFLQVTDQRGLKTSSTHANLVRPEPVANHAVIPTPKLERDFYDWHKRHASILRIKDEVNPEVVLIGDSITHMWGGRLTEPKRVNGADAWNELFGDRALNLGFGWDRTQNVLWRIDHGELDGLAPKTVIVHIGTNNLAGTKNHVAGTPEQIAEGIKAICQRVQTKVPKAKVLLMAVFPRGEKPTDPNRAKIAKINEQLPAIAKELNIQLIDITAKLLNDDGTMSREIAGDFLHPSEKGYKIWADAVRTHLAK